MPAVHTTSASSLSPLQQGLLSHQPDGQTSRLDLVQVVMDLPEPVDAGAFTRAWHWLTARHAVLRTAFGSVAPGQPPAAQVNANLAPELVWADWSALSAATREHKWRQLQQRDRDRGFALACPPLWRVAIVQTAPRLFRLLFTFHHLLLDARALVVLFLELFVATEAYAAGREPVLEEPVPYARYLAWVEEQPLTGSAAYWRRVLADFSAPTPLPAPNRIVPADTLAEPAHRTFLLPAGKTAMLRTLATLHNVTLNTLVQGAWALLLSRHSGEENVLFGAVRACRHGSVPGAERIVGLMINTVPLAVAVPPTARVIDWLRDLRKQWLELRAHEHVPLPAVRQWSALPPGAPLFGSLVSFQDPGWDHALRAEGGAWLHRRCETRSYLDYPLALDAVADRDELQLTLAYDAARYTPAAIDRLLGHLTTLLDGLAAEPHRRLAAVPMLSPAEQYQLLQSWNRQPVTFADLRPVPALIAEQATRTPAALALTDRAHSLDYGTWHARALTLAAHLREQGVGPGKFVGVCLDPSVELPVALLAVWQAGGAYVPLDPTYPTERLAFQLRDSGAAVLVTQCSLRARCATPELPTLLVDELPADGASAAPAASAVNGNDPAYLIYTSGSTGEPKGVVIRHDALANLVAWHRATYAVTVADRATQLASPAFDACVWELWPYLAAGASVHSVDAELRQSPAALVRWLARQQITLCFLPTPLAEAVMDESWPADTAMRAILTGGDRLRRWPGSRLPCPLYNHYGPTECTVLATSALVTPTGEGAPAIGRPMANTELYVLDRHQQPLPIGAPGELYLGGAGVAEGYHGRPALTAEKFIVPTSGVAAGRRLYRTGDLVRWREDGQLDYLGRLDQQVKIRGHRIEPAEIETCLARHPSVRECLVLPREDERGETRLVAYLLSVSTTSTPTAAELAEFLHRHLPAYLVPSAYVTLSAWPLTSRGKIDRRQLPAPTTSPATPAGVTPPRPGVESVIADVWSEVLGRANLGSSDDFFLLGGHSLRAAQVVSRLNTALRVRLSVRHLFDHSTIASLAAAISRMTPADSVSASSGLRALAQRG